MLAVHCGEHLVAPPGVRADPQRPADVVQHDRRLGEGARQRGQLGDLRVVQPGVEGEAERRQLREARAEGGVGEQPGSRRVGRARHRGVPGVAVADAAEAIATGAEMRLQHLAAPARRAVRSAWPTIPAQTRVGP